MVCTNVKNKKKYSFVLYKFDNKENAKNALLELPCIQLDEVSGQIICTEVLDYGYFPYEINSCEYEAMIAGDDLTIELWELAKTNFEKHNGNIINELKPEKITSRINRESEGIVYFISEKKVSGSIYRV